MKKIFTTVVALLLMSSFSFAQDTGGDKAKKPHAKTATKPAPNKMEAKPAATKPEPKKGTTKPAATKAGDSKMDTKKK